MAHSTIHPSDQTLLLALDGELSPRDVSALEQHLDTCGECRARRHHLEAAAEEFVRACRVEATAPAADVGALRDRLRASMGLAEELDHSGQRPFVRALAAVPRAVLVAAALVAMLAGAAIVRNKSDSRMPGPVADVFPNGVPNGVPAGVRDGVRDGAMDGVADAASLASEPGILPVRALTPGATRAVRVDELCAGGESTERPVSTAVRQAVLRDYGMEAVPAREYELDYLITPALGGSDDRLNLWPERYAARVWNARVKDELEHLLPQLVCRGQVDLETAQRDIAVNWIAAYQKYFHSDRPVGSRVGALRDGPAAPTLVSFVARTGPTPLRPR